MNVEIQDAQNTEQEPLLLPTGGYEEPAKDFFSRRISMQEESLASEPLLTSQSYVWDDSAEKSLSSRFRVETRRDVNEPDEDDLSFSFRARTGFPPPVAPIMLRSRSSLRDAPSGLPRSHSSSSPRAEGEQSVRKTMQLLYLDASRSFGVVVSWGTGLVLIGLAPLLIYLCLEPKNTESGQQLPFRLLVMSIQSSLAAVAFLFIHSNVRQHGLRGVLFLDVAAEETFEVQEEYEKCLKQAWSLLLRVFFPAFVLHEAQTIWLFWEIPLKILPFELPVGYRFLEVGTIVVLTSASWIFETTTYLFVCVIFWKVCTLQELKMNSYREVVRKCVDPAFCFREYSRIIAGLSIISHRFRLFLALTGGITVFGALASMYQMVLYRDGLLNFFNSGNVAVANWVALMGAGLCLKSASKIAHLHRRIVKVACTMHAQQTYEAALACSSPRVGSGADRNPNTALQSFCQRQESWMQRAALVNYLANTTAGISVYGFVLDRSFVHTTLGALLTTTWFILGRSLSGSLPTLTSLFSS